MIQSGKMRHRITIKAPHNSQNGYGEVVESWVDVFSVWASKEPLLGKEYFSAEAVQSLVEVKFRLRYRPGVTNEMRIQHGSDQYHIISVIDIESRQVEMLIYAKKVVT